MPVLPYLSKVARVPLRLWVIDPRLMNATRGCLQKPDVEGCIILASLKECSNYCEDSITETLSLLSTGIILNWILLIIIVSYAHIRMCVCTCVHEVGNDYAHMRCASGFVIQLYTSVHSLWLHFSSQGRPEGTWEDSFEEIVEMLLIMSDVQASISTNSSRCVHYSIW